MPTLGSESDGCIYEFDNDELLEILIYDEAICQWYNVKDLLEKKYPKEYKRHCDRAWKLYSSHYNDSKDCLSLAKADAERKMTE